MAQYTPMMQQYLAVKAQVPDAFLFFRLGDFYEMFFEDAINASRELEITLTGREGGAEERIPMCGVPHHSAENYIARLIEKGYKVALCEQVEDPAEAKGVVRREIVRIVTPGTVMDSKLLGETSNNYIVSLNYESGAYAFTACDISTGELYTTGLGDSLELVVDEMNVYMPSEVIGSAELLEAIGARTAGWSRTAVLTPWSAADEELLEAHFAGDPALPELSGVSRRGVALLLGYLRETQKRALTHVKQIRVYEPEMYMTMDPFTRRNLELVETVRERAKKGSLLWLLDRTVTAMGARLLRRWIEKPLMSAARIGERLEAVELLVNQLIVREDLKLALREVYDLERLVARISYGNANARDMVALMASLRQVPLLREACASSGSATLKKLVAQMDGCEDVMGWIEAAIVDEPPVSIRDGGMIRPGYHAYLDQLREASTSGKVWIAELERKEREATGIKSLKIGYNKVFGYFIEVTKANMGALPEGRYERKQTLANAERYVTPELKEKEALILEAQDKMIDLEYELFTELRERISGHISRLQKLAEIIATADVYQSLAAVSAASHFRKPEVGEGYELRIEEGRHPVVEAVLEGGSFIANDTRLEREDGRILLITGPNMAGKSTYMRQVAVICLMAQIGCFVPARAARIPIIDRVFTRIGAADDLIGGQSTFMVEMMDIQIMTEKATPRSLVIIDELGRGTSTGEGMAIAQAVIEYLHDRVGCKTLVSTHFHELAHLEESLAHLRNHCMAVKESGNQVTFLRKLIRGAASTSYGIYCAEIAGLPDSIIQRSYELLHSFDARPADRPEEHGGAAALAQTASAGARRTDAGSANSEPPTATDALANASPAGASRPQREPSLPERVLAASAAGTQPLVLERGAGQTPASPVAPVATAGPEAEADFAKLHSATAGAELASPAPADASGARDAAEASGFVQLSLFADEQQGDKSKRKPEGKQLQVLEQLKSADLINMTPLAALNLIYELKQKLQG
ncbi:DNA mismatch repair protein MutS [Paenibacillus athensensis]|uniref:DNA mismatch repair protein MutS n=1 Tax=Paenibacillus athensensis TaxID=1967502 RepID=A0A4Y8Q7Y0_9BACL|nr:DNA mismatch repair protein MutS [Paenibacillus athensensis]MCD1257344.1 DNA mismatch repair protein MutS [Paenibacillus athensensis]